MRCKSYVSFKGTFGKSEVEGFVEVGKVDCSWKGWLKLESSIIYNIWYIACKND